MPKSPTLAELLSLSQANGIHRLYFPIDWSCLTFIPAFVAGVTLPLVQASADGPTAARILRCLGAETRGWQNASGKRASDSPLHQGAPLTSKMQMSSTHLYTFFWTHPNYENDIAKQSQNVLSAKTFKTSQRTTDRSCALPLPPVKSTPSTMPSAANWMRCEMLCFKRCNTTLTNSFDLTTASSQQLGLIQNHIEL